MDVVIVVLLGWGVWRISKKAIANFVTNYSVGGLAAQGFVVLDFETTGLSPKQGDRVVQVALVKLDMAGKRQEVWSSIVNPGRDVGPTEIHGITNQMVASAPTFAELADQIMSFIGSRIIVAHNARFDLSFLVEELAVASRSFELDKIRVFDTMTNAGQFIAFLPDKKMETCVVFSGISTAGLPGRGFHDAVFDASAEGELLKYYLRTDKALVMRSVTLGSDLKISQVTPEDRGFFQKSAARTKTATDYFETQKILDPQRVQLKHGDEVHFVNVIGNEWDRVNSWAKNNRLVLGERITKSRTKLVIAGEHSSLSINVEKASSWKIPLVTASQIHAVGIVSSE